MTEDTTLPPRKPNTIRVFLATALAWLKAHPYAAAALGGVLAGLLLPPVVRLIL